MQTEPPTLSLDMRMKALEKANDIRSRRARFKEQMRQSRNGGGKKRALELLTEVPEWAESMKVRDLLLAVPKIGVIKVERLLNRAQCSPSKTLHGLTDRQRKALAAEVRAF